MPELPEVETIRRGLARRVVGKEVAQILGDGGRLVRNNPGGVADIRDLAIGATISKVARRGKFMWLVFEGGDAGAPRALVVHLGMSGQVRYRSKAQSQTPLGKHEHLRMLFEGGGAISFVDQRTFGHLTVSELQVDGTGRVVPEVSSHIAPDLLELTDLRDLISATRKRKRIIKSLLLDQGLVSGVGNIYADEALHRAGVHGAVRGCDLTEVQAGQVFEYARGVMALATKQGGTSFDDLYVDAEGDPGYFERSLRVYGRGRRACRKCGSSIQRIRLQGRSHFHCPRCQPPPGAP